jgi:hypothetical protein
VLGRTLAHGLRSILGNATDLAGVVRWRDRPGLAGRQGAAGEAVQALGKPGPCA